MLYVLYLVFYLGLLCVCICGFLPRFDVPFSVVVTLVAGRISLILYL